MSAAADSFVLPVDKPRDLTSHDVVARVRRTLGVRRVGHTGTLDPFATGLLLLCVGRATRIAEYLTGMDKHYHAVARLGVRTDSHDRDGAVVAESDAWQGLTLQDVQSAADELVGPIQQRPPSLSAKKVGGERAHRLTRAGRPPELPAVEVLVHALEVNELSHPDVSFNVHCGSGTYVRALARDLGDLLGCGAHLTALRRTRIGVFSVADAVSLAEVEANVEWRHRALSPAAALSHLARVTVTEEGERELGFGRPIESELISKAEHADDAPVAAVRDGRLLAIGSWTEGRYRPRKVFST